MAEKSIPSDRSRPRPIQWLAWIVIGVAVGVGFYRLSAEPAVESSGETVEWESYGRDPGGSRFSPLEQINRETVGRLEVAWVYRTGDFADGSDDRPKTAFESTPIVVDGTLYVSTIYGRVIALDPATGQERWNFNPEVDQSVHRSEIGNRGVATWVDAKLPADDPTRRRIFVATIDARLIALDAATGKKCSDFGDQGQIDLTRGVELGDKVVEKEDYGVTSAPAILDDLVIVGSAIGDNRAVTVERGLVRAFDVRSGELKWFFDPIPRDAADPAQATWENDSATRTGASNVWAPISVDPERKLVFVPTSSPSPDYYGGDRPGKNEYSNSVVALRGATGEVAWHYQIVHHDLWDYDLPAQPTLITVRKDGRDIPAVAQATKMGFLFLLDRETGEPIYPVEERAVPQSDVPGEVSWPTQRFPTGPPPLATATATPDDAWGVTPWDRAQARAELEKYRYEGMYTPPSFKGSIEFPGIAGGTNWGGVSFQPERGLVVLNMTHLPFLVKLFPREEFNYDQARETWRAEYARQLGTPYVMGRAPLFSPLGLPATKPPWGTLAAVDVNTGKVKWEVPLGTTRDLAPVPLPLKVGVPNMGGSICTGGDLVLIGAAVDNYLRAFDVETGAELWKRRLPAGGQATPMTYQLKEPSGEVRQYVVIAAGGHGKLGTTIGDHVVGFVLRSRTTVYVLLLLDALLAAGAVIAAARWLNLQPIAEGKRFVWLRRLGRGVKRLAGLVFLLAAVGLVLPWLVDGSTWLTSLSAVTVWSGLLLMTLGAILRGHVGRVPAVFGLLALASVVAYMQMGELFWVGPMLW